MKNYIKKLYESRFFWTHLARIELKNKFRRSKLGILWTFISPLCLTAIMATVFAVAFQSDIIDYAPYILSGLLFWEVLNSALQAGANSIIANGAYIQQFNHPITIYTLKSAIVYVINFIISMISLEIWVCFINPQNLFLGFFTLPLTAIIIFGIAWAGSTIAAYINTKYRDYPQMIPLIMQTLWYVSPVFFQEDMFESNALLYAWFQYNPITHLLFLIRKPFLYGVLPSIGDYLYGIAVVLILTLWAYYLNKKNQENIIFYI